ncbi:MAG: serine hydrolase [Deltaproteobacteria bacterium]|nr:serine hydrolase [Deltaproteobacteria bacterium]MBI4374004.1 serine hydrolase [Deltaproteobacteria bacterium]
MYPFEEQIFRALEDGVFPGAALLVARGEEILYRNFFGASTLLPEKEGLTEATLFDIASLTKPVAATTLLLLLLKTKRLSLDTPIAKLLKELDGEDKSKITPRHLLKHTSGLPAWKPYFEEVKKEKPDLFGKKEAASIYVDKISQESLEFPIAYERLYSDLGFILLGIYLEKIFQIPLDLQFQREVAAPLGLTRTHYLPNDKPPEDRTLYAATEESSTRGRLLRGEVHDDNAYALGGVAGHAGLFSHVDDLHRLLAEWQKGIRGTSELLPKELVDEFIGIRSKFKIGWDTPASVNSQTGSCFSINTVGHLGYTGCSFWMDLGQNFHVIFLTNRVHPTSRNEKIKEFRPLLHDLIYKELIRK